MDAIQMSLDLENQSVALPCAFIDHYMLKGTPVYVLIYLYGFRQSTSGKISLSAREVGRHFHILETDVVNAWVFWESEGLLTLQAQGEFTHIAYLPVRSPVRVEPEAEAKAPVKAEVKPFAPAGRPQYTVEELSVYRSQSRDIERLYAQAEQALGKLLTYHDMNVLFGFYDWLRLPVDVIQYLLVYSAERDRRDLRYIERVAIDWAENGIDDVEKALSYVQTFDRDYRDILKAMGQTAGVPSPTQRKYIQKWLKEYEMPVAMVVEACDRAAANTGKTNVRYVNKVIEQWHKQGVHTLAEAQAADEDFARRKSQPSSAQTSPEAKPKGRSNRFINFKQRERDYTKLEKMEREHLMQSLKG